MQLTPQNKSRLGLVLLAFIAFIALGLPDSLLGVAWPSIRTDFSQPLDALGLLLFTAMAGYLVSSSFSGQVVTRLGIGKVLALSCAITGGALIGYTLVPSWGFMVALGVFAGLGAGGIDAGLNTYVAANFGAGVMQWLHASYGVGITLGPLIMTFALTSLNNWRGGYLIVGGVQLALAVLFSFTLHMWTKKASSNEPEKKLLTDYKTPVGETLRQPSVWLSIFQFFLYTGSEVTLGTWSYSLLTESRGISADLAGFWTSGYWASFTVGRILAGLYAKRIGVNKLIYGSLLSALFGAVLLWWNPSATVSVVGVGLIGFAIAPIFPGLVSGTSQRVGDRFAANTIGMQMSAASLGVSIIPALVGVLARNINLEVVPVVLFGLFAAQLLLYTLGLQFHKQRDARKDASVDAGSDGN
ncbi:MAG: MFS transporter [Anaerolineaceae bacterium]